MIKTCSKESGQRLVELGVKTDSRFYHWYDDLLDSKTHNTDGCTPAWTACELGEMLKEMNISYRWNLAGEFECLLHFGLNSINDYETYAIEIAEAMALMLIWLLENGHITAEEINEGGER